MDLDKAYHQSPKPVEDSHHSQQLVTQDSVTKRSNFTSIFGNQSIGCRSTETKSHSVKSDRTAFHSTDIGHLQPQDASHGEELTFPKSNRSLDDPEQPVTQLLLNSHFGNWTQRNNLGATQEYLPIGSEAPPCVSEASPLDKLKNSTVDKYIAPTEIKALQNILPSPSHSRNNSSHSSTLLKSPMDSFTIPNRGSNRNSRINIYIGVILLFRSILIQVIAKLVSKIGRAHV